MAWVRRGERGAAALEFALLMPLLLALVFGIIAYGYMFSFRQALSQAASEGARAAVGGPTTGCAAANWNAAGCAPGTAAANAINGVVSGYRNRGTTLACGAGSLTCTIAQSASCATGHTCVAVTVSYPYRSNSLLPTVPGFGFTLPSTLSFTSVVQVS